MNQNVGSSVSLVDRLRKQFGSDVDPEITLGSPSSGEHPTLGPERSGGASSGVLSRLGSRPALTTRYHLEGEIARGGMGAILEVWDEDLRRSLAMKVALASRGEGSGTKPEDLDAKVLARFLEEAQVTGQLEHPGIVPVHELGLDENGQLYFTMPLVRGRDLDHIFSLVAKEEEGWSITRALGVLLKACEAMAYAHNKGVIHRDLKPANVMVGSFGEVYVMDWGLARVRGFQDRHDCRVATQDNAAEVPVALDARADADGLEDDALYTMDGDVIGTPAFMAPEQARGQLDALDARTDVYGLGAMLYRLLARTPPFVKEGERRPGLEILADLLEGPPQPLEELAPDVPLELVAITEKAMARQPEDRYSDMSELAEDLRAFLENRVVRAYETGAVAEARKWIRRNKPLAASLAAGLAILAGGLVVTVMLKGQADENALLAEQRRVSADLSAANAEVERARAEVLKDEATASAALAKQSQAEAEASAEDARKQSRINAEVNRFLNEELLSAAGVQGFGRDVKVRDILSYASRAIEGQFKDEPAVAASLHLTLAESFDNLGEYELADRHSNRGLELSVEKDGQASSITLRALRAVGNSLSRDAKFTLAAERYEEAIELSKQIFGPNHYSVATSMSDLALVYQELGNLDRTRELYEQAIEIESEGADDNRGNEATLLGNYGRFLHDVGELDAAERALLEAFETHEKWSGKEHPNTLTNMSNLALLYADQGRLREAEKLQRKIARLRDKVLGEEHPDSVITIANLGVLYLSQGKYSKACTTLEEALTKTVRIFGEDHPESLKQMHNLSSAYVSLGEDAKAIELLEPTLEARRRVLGNKHPDTMDSMNTLAVLYKDLSRYNESEELYRETLALQTEVLGPEHPTTLVTQENLGGLLYTTGDYEGSIFLTQAVLEGRKRVLGTEHIAVAKTTYNLAMIKMSTGDATGAIDLQFQALSIARRAVGNVHPVVAECLRQLGDLHMNAKDYATAEPHYRESVDILRQLGPDDRTTGYLLHQLGYALYAQERYEDAVTKLTEALALRLEIYGEDDSNTLATKLVLAKSLYRAGRSDEAEPIAIDCYERKLAQLGSEHPETQSLYKLLENIATAREE
ncbi:MAG: serine/threonine protein kinase/Tfp pilus assembly protein PilF [Planctomycetota bacterium]|jgi:serine/threonine protein kinase/Tfp pilus assembly protein PilF